MNHFTTKMTEQYVQQMYQKNVGTKRSNDAKETKEFKEAKERWQDKQEDAAAVYEGSANKTDKVVTYQKPKATKQSDLKTKLAETYEKLSEEAKAYLEELKAKYGDIEFFVADCASDEEMNRYFAMGTKQYSCVISSETIEKMATDEEARAKYEAIIDGADETLEEVKAEITEEFGEEAAEQIERFGISIDDNGVVDYFVKLRESNDSYYEKLREKRVEERADDKKSERAEREHKREETKEPKESTGVWLHADSKEGLLAAIKEALGLNSADEIVIAKTEETKTDEAE